MATGEAQPLECGMFHLDELVWIVATHTGDGHHLFNRLQDAMAYIHSTRKDCTVTAVNKVGRLMFQHDLIASK